MRGAFVGLVVLGLAIGGCAGAAMHAGDSEIETGALLRASTPAASIPVAIAGPAMTAAPALNPPAVTIPPAYLGLPVPALSANAAVVLDGDSGAILFDSNGTARLAPASLTKIATAIVVLQSGLDLDEPATVDVDSTKMPGSSVMGLLPGDRFTARQLLYGLLLPSGNDAALALGRAVSGSDGAFVQQMNALASRLGLHDTHFANAHGLTARDHYSSARDLAYLARYAMADERFAEIVRTPSYVAEGSREISLSNVNTLLAGYPGADGVKTGYTGRAGPTLVGSVTRGGHRVYVVLLHDTARAADAAALFDWAFAAFHWTSP